VALLAEPDRRRVAVSALTRHAELPLLVVDLDDALSYPRVDP
jgi:hypothetical protein